MTTDESEKTLALFDFDGTITKKDTLFEMMKFLRGKRSFYFGMAVLSPYLFLYLVKILPNWKAKEKLFTYFFGGMSSVEFASCCEEFAHQSLSSLIRKRALDKIQDFKEKGARIIVVTASAESWVAPWCRQLNLECIGTRLEIKKGRLTGKIDGRNCNGDEKVNRIKSVVNLSNYDEIIAYGDSKNDLPMLQLATQPYYRAFHDN